MITWSPQQEAIFRWFEGAHGLAQARHLVVRARAGTGKTTTAIEALNYAPESNILVCAFNRSIAEEFNFRIKNGRARAQTLHSVGAGIVRRYWPGIPTDTSGAREQGLTDRVCGNHVPDAVKRLVSKLHTKAREIKPHARALGELTELLWKFECAPDESWNAQGYNEEYVEVMALKAMVLAEERPSAIDFADMIFLPVRMRWGFKRYDMVVVDEAQDMTEAQLELALSVCRGRFVLVGDDRQAIYDFRGADTGSLDRLKAQLGADELGLTVTRRCPKNIVAEAKKLVPDFEAADEAPDGEFIDDLPQSKLNKTIQHGDFLLSRMNAPLVAAAMSLLRDKKRARIKGRDIGASLKKIVKQLNGGSVNEFLMRVDSWEDTQVLKYQRTKAESRIALVRDQAETLRTIAEGADSTQEIVDRIEYLFTDDGLGNAGVITCSSVHRAKGLEANRVFVLGDTLRNHNQEEKNIQYVAITRAKQQLTMVYKDGMHVGYGGK